MTFGERVRVWLATLLRQLKILFWIVTVGALLVLSSLLILSIIPEADQVSSALGYLGFRVMVLGYPLYLLVLVIFKLIQQARNKA